MAAFRLIETKQNLFHVSSSYALAHAVAATFDTVKGTLAWQFSLIFGDVDDLRKRPIAAGNVAVLDSSRFVYYLVTKENHYDVSTYDNVQSALICLREHMRNHELTKVAMPRICCGHDGLDWKRVKKIIQQVFANEFGVELLVCDYNDISHAPPKCQITEAKGSLFTAPENFALVHSVSADFAMCSGINFQFKCKYGGPSDDARKQQPNHIGNVAVVEQNGRYIYNLVTKERYHEKCTFTALYYALCAMREHMREHGVSKLAIPRLGCGIERLDWLRVQQLLELVFAKDDVEIIAFFYEPPTMVGDSIEVRCPTCRQLKKIRVGSVGRLNSYSSRSSLYKEKSPF